MSRAMKHKAEKEAYQQVLRPVILKLKVFFKPTSTPQLLLQSFVKQQATKLLGSAAPTVISALQTIFRVRLAICGYLHMNYCKILTIAYNIYPLFSTFLHFFYFFNYLFCPCRVHIITVWCVALNSRIPFTYFPLYSCTHLLQGDH